MSKQPNSYEPTGRYVEPANSINWWKWIIGFDGRINRSGLIVRVLIFLMSSFVSRTLRENFDGELIMYIAWVFSLGFVFGIPMCICGLVRRFHDRGKSGWRVLLLLIPIWGLVVAFELYFFQGDLTDNEFGTPPVGLRVG